MGPRDTDLLLKRIRDRAALRPKFTFLYCNKKNERERERSTPAREDERIHARRETFLIFFEFDKVTDRARKVRKFVIRRMGREKCSTLDEELDELLVPAVEIARLAEVGPAVRGLSRGYLQLGDHAVGR